MLAEPKRKIKWSPNPCGNLWSKDSSKFGQKILEKFGWTPGKGLGVNEQGITGPVRLKCNSTQKGLGFERGSKLECFQHQREFDMILSKLSSSSDGLTVKESCTSLEQASKNCRTRVHYHKFTRGKDLSRYSEKDLSCILGGVPFTDVKPFTKKTPEDNNEDIISNEGSDPCIKDDVKPERKRKRKRKCDNENSTDALENISFDNKETEISGVELVEFEEQSKTKAKSKKKRKYLESDPSHEWSISAEVSSETQINCDNINSLPKTSKSKRKKSKKNVDCL